MKSGSKIPRRPKKVFPASQMSSDFRKRRLRTCSSCCNTSSRAITSARRTDEDRLLTENGIQQGSHHRIQVPVVVVRPLRKINDHRCPCGKTLPLDVSLSQQTRKNRLTVQLR